GAGSVLELLRAAKRPVKTVYVAGGITDDPTIDEIKQRADNRLRVVPPDRLEKVARTETNQGVVALAAPLRAVEFDELVKRDNAFLVAVGGVTDTRQLAAL